MADYTRNYDFQSGDVISSSQVDEEFNDIATAIASKPDADTTLQTSLNADQVDGYHAADDGGDGTIPVCSGDVQTNLNAEMVGGLTASDIGTAGFASGTAMLFYQSSAPSGWTKSSNPSIDRCIGVSSSGTGGSDNSETSWASSDFTVTINGHTLTTDEVPAVSVAAANAVSSSVGASTGWETALVTSRDALSFTVGLTNGGGGAHGHSGSTVASQSDYRVPIRWVIICTKD